MLSSNHEENETLENNKVIEVIVPPIHSTRPYLDLCKQCTQFYWLFKCSTILHVLSWFCSCCTGLPVPVITWRRNRVTVSGQTESSETGRVQSTLLLPPLKRTDWPMTLSCSASNSERGRPLEQSFDIDMERKSCLPLSFEIVDETCGSLVKRMEANRGCESWPLSEMRWRKTRWGCGCVFGAAIERNKQDDDDDDDDAAAAAPDWTFQ